MQMSVELYTLSQKFGDEKAIDLAKEAGFDAIDYSYYWGNEKEAVLGEGYRDYAMSLRKKLDAAGLVCNQAHAPFSFGYGATFDVQEPKYLWLVRSIESAAILGATTIVVHALSVPDEVDFEAYNIAYYQSLIPYCEKYGIRVAVENLFSYDGKRKRMVGKLGSPRELNRIVKEIASPFIVACIDLGHASLTGYEPEDFIAKTDKNILKALHVQDNNYLSDEHTLPFLGELHWNAVMEALKKNGYTGDLTFEIFHYLERFPAPLIPDALKLAAATGRYLISLYDACEAQ